MSGADEEWVQAAMSDDAIVVDLLVRLHHAPPSKPPPPNLKPLPLEWSVRQRRSKSVSVNPKRPAAHRGSPTTPLSWSCATSFSCGSAGPGSEDSSRLVPFRLSDTTRSKVSIDCEKSTSKRSRKKKTLAELKDEVNLLLKESRELKREMAALRTNLERQRAKNENLKRMKVELKPRLDTESTSVTEESISGQELTACDPTMLSVVSDDNVTELQSKSNACPKETAGESSGPKFFLPDLNVPFDDEPSFDVLNGVS